MVSEKELIQQGLYQAERLSQLHAVWKLHDKQKAIVNAIFRDGYRKVRIDKGRKAGATELAGYLLTRIIGLAPLRATYLIGPTQKAEAEIAWHNRKIHRAVPNVWRPKFTSDYRVRLPNQSYIKVEGANDPEAARGFEGDAFIWDEAKDHNPASLDACFPNVLPRNALWVVMGTPATTKDNYFWKHKLDVEDDPSWFKIHMTAWDNTFLPGGHEWLEREKESYYKRGDWDLWEIEWEGRWIFNARNKVLPNFTTEKHVRPYQLLKSAVGRDASHLKWLTVIDPGYATVFAVLFMAYNPYTQQFYILDEIYSKQRSKNSVADLWPEIRRKQNELYSGRWTNLYDSAAAGFAVEVQAYLRDNHDRALLVPTKKAPNDEEDYFRAINSCMFVENRFYISDRCVETIGEIENYETDENSKYPDKNNHALDDLRYGFKYVGYNPNISSKAPPIEVLTTTITQQTNGQFKDSFDPNNIKDKKSQDWQGYSNFTLDDEVKGWLQ